MAKTICQGCGTPISFVDGDPVPEFCPRCNMPKPPVKKAVEVKELTKIVIPGPEVNFRDQRFNIGTKEIPEQGESKKEKTDIKRKKKKRGFKDYL